MARVYTMEAAPLAGAGTTAIPVRVAGGGSPGRAYAGLLGFDDWRSGIIARPRFAAAFGFDENGPTGGTASSTTTVEIGSSTPGYASTLAGYYWRDTRVTIKSADDEVSPLVWRTEIVGNVTDWSSAGDRLALTIADLGTELSRPLVTATFAGTGGLEGGAEAAGRVKRRNLGRVFNVELRILDKANNVYEGGDPARRASAFTEVRDKGAAGIAGTAIAWQGSATATLTALRAATVPTGGYVAAPSIQAVKWWTQPAGPLTADITGEILPSYVETAPDLVAKLVGEATSITIANLAAANAARPHACGVSIDDAGTTIANVLDRLLLPLFLQWTLGLDGVLTFREVSFANPVETVRSSREERETTFRPLGTRTVGYRRNYRPQSASEIATGTPNDIQGSSDYDPANPGVATWHSPPTTGDTYIRFSTNGGVTYGPAVALGGDVSALIAELDRIQSDSWLSAGEKPYVKQLWKAIGDEATPLAAQANAASATSEAAALVTARNALGNYLASLSPAWDDVTTDTPIVGATFNQKFTDYYFARANLLRAITVAQKLATDGLAASILSIGSDNVLSKGEKPLSTLIKTLIQSEYDAILAKWQALGSPAYAQSQASTAGTRVQAMIAYLGNLSPGWDDRTQDTPIDGPTYNAIFTNASQAVALFAAALTAQPGADAIELRTTGPRAFTMGYTYDGQPKGSFGGAGGTLSLWQGSTQLAATFSLGTVVGVGSVGGPDPSGGNYGFGSLTADKGYVDLRATYQGQTYTIRIDTTRIVDGTPGTSGPAPGSTVTQSLGYDAPDGAMVGAQSPTVIGSSEKTVVDMPSVSVPAGRSVTISFQASYHPTPAGTVQKVVRLNSNVYLDRGSGFASIGVTTGSDGYYTPGEGPDAGSLFFSTSITNTSGANQTWRVAGNLQQNAGIGAANQSVTFSGSCTVTVSGA